MSVTINAFPPLHACTSARSWFLAMIVLLHVGFFWVLSSGLSHSLVTVIPKPFTTYFHDAEIKPVPPPQPPIDFKVLTTDQLFVPTETPIVDFDDKEAWIVEKAPEPMPATPPSGGEVERPTMTQPQIDPRYGLSEPMYPPQEIRLDHAGTVMLSVYVLENGRVGQVRIEQSSGYQRLDNSAAREARKWRFKPGMRDGAPVPMWKQIPITFRLNN